MRAVIVNGQVTVRDDVLLPVFAGQPIRFEPEAKPRFEPITVESWNAQFSTGIPSDFAGCDPEGHKH
jgi:N-acyl-D-glutamate deacylase